MFHIPGTDVPRATKAMAVTVSFRPTVHPRCDARSPMTAVSAPIPMIANTKHNQPLHISVNHRDVLLRSGNKGEKE